MFIQSNIKNESDYIKFLLQFAKNNFEKNDIQVYMMDNSYCLKCKKQTKNLNSKGFVTKNEKYLVKFTCNICKSKKSNLFQNKMLLVFLFNYFQNYQY